VFRYTRRRCSERTHITVLRVNPTARGNPETCRTARTAVTTVLRPASVVTTAYPVPGAGAGSGRGPTWLCEHFLIAVLDLLHVEGEPPVISRPPHFVKEVLLPFVGTFFLVPLLTVVPSLVLWIIMCVVGYAHMTLGGLLTVWLTLTGFAYACLLYGHIGILFRFVRLPLRHHRAINQFHRSSNWRQTLGG
jgi:hypothetical protein